MKLYFNELRFFLFFIPIFVLKLINITASDKSLIIVSLICFLTFTVQMYREKFEKKEFFLFMVIMTFCAILVLTCGKQGAFFSIITIIALKDIDCRKRIYIVCSIVAVLGTLVSMYIERNGASGLRYINGEWREIFKRSNILYISFMTIIGLYVLQKRKINKIEWIVITLLGYRMYKYTGSRTGLLVLLVFTVSNLILSNKLLARSKFIRLGCVLSPLICMLFSVTTNYLYGQYQILDVLNWSMQGRLALGKAYLERYQLKLLGQKIFESVEVDNFWNLDCAYLDMLLCYGVLFAILWVVVSSYVICWLYEQKRFAEVALVMMYAVYGISETFLPNCFLNVSLFLYAEYIYFITNKKEESSMI